MAPKRIVCLTAEAADWFWRLGAWDAVAGVTAWFDLPPGAAPKPRVSGFNSVNINSLLRLDPDLIITFSDVQADIAAQLIRHGCPVLATNQRTIEETEATLALLARCVDREKEAGTLLNEFRARLEPVSPPARRPRVYFEEWNDPLITGIAWVGELIERAGGEDVFGALRFQRRAPDRAVTMEQVLAANPEIIFASWCGKPVSMEAIANRPGWSDLPAIRHGRIHELRGEDILQPGFRLVHGYEEIKCRLEARGEAIFNHG